MRRESSPFSRSVLHGREIQKLRRRLHAAIGVAREEGKSSPRHERYRLTIAFYPLETGGADATRTPPAKKRTAKKRGAR